MIAINLPPRRIDTVRIQSKSKIETLFVLTKEQKNMELFVCNNCFTTPHRGKKPFCLTQCGHIYCNGCIRQAEKQCPQCQQMDIFSVELQQPSLSKVENFFAPLNESLELLQKTSGFQNNQIKITLERFHEIDKKYEMLKSHYYNLMQNMKVIKDKYLKLKMENIEQKKRLMSFEIQNSRFKTLNSFSDTSTPKSSNQKSFRTRPTSNSYVSSCGTNVSNKSFNTTKGKAMLDSFRIPFDPRTMRSIDSRATLTANSTYL